MIEPGTEAARDAALAAAGHEPNRGEQPTASAPSIKAAEIPADLQETLREMVRAYEMETEVVRRHKVQQWMEAEEFWRGRQHLAWSARDGRWVLPESVGPEVAAGAGDLGSRYVVNYYQAWGMSIISALTAAPPKVQYLPASAESEQDVATARAATKIVEYIGRLNPMDRLRLEEAHALWTQGIWAAYVRFVVDGHQFGWRDEPVTEDQELDLGPVLLPDGSTARQTVVAPVQVGAKKMPNGGERIDVYGPLYFKVPPQARSQAECYFLIHSQEFHVSTLRAAFPQKASQIQDPGSFPDDVYERIVRLSLSDAQGAVNSLPLSHLVTYTRAWLRPEAFWAHADEQRRARLLEMFPHGAMVSFAGDVFLEARDEALDDHWVICTGLPAVGMLSDGMGQSAISVQRQINTAAGVLAEHASLASAPPILYDARYVNGDALADRRMEPGCYVPVVVESAGPQIPLSDLIYQPTFHVDPQLWGAVENLATQGEFLTGALPSIFGGGSKNLKTATAYAQAREQAMGRLNIVWRNMREAHARLMKLAVECFRRNRTEDVEIAVEGKGGQFQSQYIRLGELQGNFTAQPSADEGFPSTFAQIRDTLMQLMNTKDPELLEVLGAPVNRPVMQRYLGLPDLVDPAGENRAKQFREIDRLAHAAPVQGPNGPQPTVMPDPLVDDHATHIEVIREWAVSDAGISLQRNNPPGWANLMAHLVAHMDAEDEIAARQGERKNAVAAAVAQTAPQPPPQQPQGAQAPAAP